MWVIGFTGTHRGLSRFQSDYITHIFQMASIEEIFEFHHGCCIGADYDAHHLALYEDAIIHLHPPTDRKSMDKRVYDIPMRTISHPDAPYLTRNRHIVEAVRKASDNGLMLACPFDERREVARSGTWATVRYARKVRVPLIIVPRSQY